MNHPEAGLRFDDKLATVLAQPRGDAAAQAIAWRQIVDILAQLPIAAGESVSAAGYAILRDMRDAVPQVVRAEAAAAIVGRRVHPAIVALIAEEKPAVAAAVIGQVHLADSEWLALLPRLSPVSRSLLRHRRDLSGAVLAGLASFGASDFALPAGDAAMAVTADVVALVPVEAPPAAVAGDTQIRDLLARIAAYRTGDAATAPAMPDDPPAPIESFRFETGTDGRIAWVEGAPRGALIGATIAQAAACLEHGVDGQAAGAFRHRAPFRDARLSVGGGSAVAGEWRIAGVPVFDPRDGRFTGYRGAARRPRADEQAAPEGADGLYGSGLPADSLRQLVHELRTPLNAIVGFGEMIERQMLGPAAFPYRARAGAIVDQGRRLLGAVDDLDMAARIDARRLESRPDEVDPAALLLRLRLEYRAVADARGVAFDLAVTEPVGRIDADPAAIERMVARLLAATIGLGQAGETMAVSLAREGAAVVLRLSRPAIIAGRDEAALLDPGYTPDGDWPDAPLLGLGFALRLIRNLAAATGGGLEIDAARFVLRLPARVADGLPRAGATPR